MKLNIKNRADYLLAATAFCQPVLLLIQCLLADSGFITVASAARFRLLTSAIMTVIALVFILKRHLTLTAGIYMVFLVLAAFSFLISPSNAQYIFSEGKYLFLICIPIFLSAASVHNKKILIKTFECISLIGVFAGGIYMILWCLGYMQLSQAPDEPVYSMGLGYGFLSVILYCIWKENKILLLIALLFSVLVLFIASRGPLVAVLLYVCIKYLWYGSKGQKTAIIVCVIAFFLFILPYIKDLGSQEYIYSISRIAKGEFFTGDAGRLPIYSKIWDKVCLSPVIGYGIFGDRPFLNGAYVHNIFLEIVCNFGLLFGIFICLSMFWFIYKNIRQLSEQLKLFVFMFISSASIQLLVSGSYLTNMILPVVFGLIYNKKLLFVEK